MRAAPVGGRRFAGGEPAKVCPGDRVVSPGGEWSSMSRSATVHEWPLRPSSAWLAISFGAVGYPRPVTKRLIEVDDEKLEAVRELLGTQTLKATVDEAFDEVLALARRRKALLEARGRDESALADPDARRAAWG